MIEKLLEAKIRIMQQQLKIKDQQIKNFEHHLRHGQWLPVGETLKPGTLFFFEQSHKESIRVIDLEIENIRLKEQLDDSRER